MNWIKSNLKYIIISIALIISAIIISESLHYLGSTYENANFYKKHETQNGMDKTGYGVDTYEQNLETEQSYYIKAPSGTITVWKNGVTHEYSGTNIKAAYYHVGQMLRVDYDKGDGLEYAFFNQPDRWTLIE